MVEALAAGTPVIALNQGGARDIVRHEVDGLLLDRAEVGLLRSAIHRVATSTWDPAALASRAREFSTERFVERFREGVATLAEARARS